MRIDLLTCIAEFEILMAKYWPSELLIFGKDSEKQVCLGSFIS